MSAARVKWGTVVADDPHFNKQVVRCDNGETFYLTYGLDAATGAKVGDRIRLEYRATRSLGLWYATKAAKGQIAEGK